MGRKMIVLLMRNEHYTWILEHEPSPLTVTFPWGKIYKLIPLLLRQTSMAWTQDPGPLMIGLCTFRSYNVKTNLTQDYDDSQRSR